MTQAYIDDDDQIADIKAEYDNINKLKFGSDFEAAFMHKRRESFLETNESLLLICGIIYLSFILTDYAVIPNNYIGYVAGSRILIAILMFVGYYFIKHRQNRWIKKHIFLFAACLILTVSCHISLSTYFLPHPYDFVFILGIVQLYIVVPAILKPHSKLCLVTMILMLLMVASSLFLANKVVVDTNSPVINELLHNFPLSYTLFLTGLIFLSAYMAYSYEKMLRQNWLDNQVTQVKSEKLLELSDKFKQLSHKDELTQLPNRRSFQERLNIELQRLYHSAKPFSLIILDVDFFKRYNDHYGHQKGDDCLRRVAKCLDDTCQRGADVPARYGGEEFMVILPDTDSQGAFYVAEKIRTAIEALNIEHKKSDLGILTVSLGAATVLSSHEIDIDRLIKRADDALYLAKKNGRNKTEIYKHSSVN